MDKKMIKLWEMCGYNDEKIKVLMEGEGMEQQGGYVETKKPSEASEEELREFMDLIIAGNQVVSGGLRERIMSAVVLFFLRGDNDELIGTGGIKEQGSSYVDYIFSNAQSDLSPDDYPYELGWLYIHPQYRARGLTAKIMEASQDFRGNMYATTRADNAQMKKVFARHGFQQEGEPYKSFRGNYYLTLYIKE